MMAGCMALICSALYSAYCRKAGGAVAPTGVKQGHSS
jgi:hypothetical protein